MSYASAYDNETGGMWQKLKSSTKSLSTSFSHLSTRSEKDGDTITSTVVHEALVKHYKHQEPFVGFPGWLGHKEDLPDEQKILRKQNEHIAKQNRPSKFRDFKEAAAELKSPLSTGTIKMQNTQERASLTRRKTAGMEFRSIYSHDKENSDHGLELPNTDKRANSQPGTLPSLGNITNQTISTQQRRPAPFSQRSTPTGIPSSPGSTRHMPTSSSDLMSARLKRRTGRSPY